MTDQPRIVYGTPTLRARMRQTLGGAVCRQLGHSPQLVEKTYHVTTGPPMQIGDARERAAGTPVWLPGRAAHQPHGYLPPLLGHVWGQHRGGGAMKLRFDPRDVGWRIGTAHEPRGGEMWVPWDRTAGVIGPQGSGKTLDLLTPALLAAPGAALVTLTKVEDLLLSLTERSRDDRPCVVLDPFGLAEGVVDELIWDPIAGCVDPKVAERRAKAFTAGTVKGAITGGTGDDAARFYAAESAKVLQGYFHAAALTGKTLEDVLQWVA
ncbi:MAG: hypothetical protein Q8P61_09005, partial [Candidatus Nanopelagicales bacterium]|nr:hypothetical protein [Candidatus Nanopelagicales bacterium]